MTIPCPTPTTERPYSIREKVEQYVMGVSIIFAIGVLLLLIPVIGWLLGFFVIAFAVLFLCCAPFLLFRRTSAIEGSCPYCSHPVCVAKEQEAVTCKVCRSRVIVHPGYFCPVGAQPPAEKSE